MRDKHNDLYDENSYESIYELEEEEYYDNAIEDLRGNVGRGTCIYCGGENTMQYEGHICFICTNCGRSVHEDIYYRWLAGDNIEMED